MVDDLRDVADAGHQRYEPLRQFPRPFQVDLGVVGRVCISKMIALIAGLVELGVLRSHPDPEIIDEDHLFRVILQLIDDLTVQLPR